MSGEDRSFLGGELKYDPDIVFDGKAPILLKVAGKSVRAQSGIVRVDLEHLHCASKTYPPAACGLRSAS